MPDSKTPRKTHKFDYLFQKTTPKKSIVKRSKSKKSSRTKSNDSIKDSNFEYLFKNRESTPKTGIGHFKSVKAPKNVPYEHWQPNKTPKESPKSRGAKKMPAAAENFLRQNLGGGKKTRRKKTRGKKKRHRRTKKY